MTIAQRRKDVFTVAKRLGVFIETQHPGDHCTRYEFNLCPGRFVTVRGLREAEAFIAGFAAALRP